MALPKSRNKKVVSSTIKTSHKLISGLLLYSILAFIYIFLIHQYKLDESYTPKSLTFKLSSTKLTRISDSTTQLDGVSDSTTQLDAIQTINVDSSSSNGTIPKFLWMFWDKGLDHLQSLSQDPKNKYAVDYQCVQSMMKLNSNTWDIKLLDESGAKSLAPIYASLLNNDTFYPKMTPTMKGDVLRLELLSRYGGVYADTSICAFAELDSFITDWVGTDKDGFWAAPKDIAKKNSSKLQSLHVDKCHDLSLLPAKRQGIKNKGAPSRTTSNWFLASTNSHNPLVDEWLRVYVNHLLTLADPTQPYFLAHCSLSQARMNNATVERIWSATTKRIQTLGKTSSSYKSKCIKGGVSSCSTIVKRPNRGYVLSGRYAHDVFGTPYHSKLKGKNSISNTTQPLDHLHADNNTSDATTSTTSKIDDLTILYKSPRPPFAPLVHTSHNCTLSNGNMVNIPVALPHLILIGTQKAGTGTIQRILKSRPDVITPKKPSEIDFLDEKVVMKAPGGRLNETNEGELCRLRKAYADEFDMKQMIHERDGQVRIAFEKTPHYMLRPSIPHAIDLLCPHKPKILVTLRHPAERAFSQYSMIVKQGNHLLPNTTFEQAIETEVDYLIQRGLLREGTLSLSEYEQRRDEFDLNTVGKSHSPILIHHDLTLEEYTKVAGNVLLINETVDGTKYDEEGVIVRPHYFPHLLFRGIYALQLLPWVKKFGQDERMMILKFEDFAGDDANQTEVEEKILLFAGLTNPVLKERKRQVKANGFTKSEMNPITKEYLTWLYQPFNDLLPTLLGEEWRGVWDEEYNAQTDELPEQNKIQSSEKKEVVSLI